MVFMNFVVHFHDTVIDLLHLKILEGGWFSRLVSFLWSRSFSFEMANRKFRGPTDEKLFPFIRNLLDLFGTPKRYINLFWFYNPAILVYVAQ